MPEGKPIREDASPLEPRLDVPWQSRRTSLREAVNALLHGPKPVRNPGALPYFGNTEIREPAPRRALATSFLTHVVCLWILLLPFWAHLEIGKPGAQLELPRIELTWAPSGNDFPVIAPPGHKPGARGRKAPAMAHRGADAFHPRQTVLSYPEHITHPHQLLIQPNAPLEAPRILPSLPNIVQLAGTPVPRPPHLDKTIKAPVVHRTLKQDVALPDLPNKEKDVAAMNFAAAPLVNQQPRMPLRPSAAQPVVTQRGPTEAGAAPQLPVSGGGVAAEEIIALSATPAPPPPQLNIPAGNLSAQLTISPDGRNPGVPGGTNDGSGTGMGGAADSGSGDGGGGRGGPDGLSISGGTNPNGASGTGGGGRGGLGGGSGRVSHPRLALAPVMPDARALAAEAMSGTPAAPVNPNPAGLALAPGMKPEDLLGHKRIYTLYVNMPNLTSATGSWVLNFAELSRGGPQFADGLSGPVPVLKVDPKYPPLLRGANVEGELILYAIIREDGSVDSIQVLQSPAAELNPYAMDALAKWKFKPALKDKRPVAVESIVRVSFHAPAR
jgi:TonB family protein